MGHGNRLLVLNEDVQTGPDVIIARSSDLAVQLPEEEQREPWWARVRDALRTSRPKPLTDASTAPGDPAALDAAGDDPTDAG